jgi:DNA-binding MarR family transcriptional regulator
MAKHAFSYASDLRPAFLAHMANRLDRLICKQTKELLIEASVEAPVACLSIMVFLSKHGSGTIADVARLDGQSHQLIQSRIAPLEKLGLMGTETDPKDNRRRLMFLTEKGKRDATKIESVSKQVAANFQAMNLELDADLMTLIENAEQYLTRNPLNLVSGK